MDGGTWVTPRELRRPTTTGVAELSKNIELIVVLRGHR
jgi:hypothetical protein